MPILTRLRKTVMGRQSQNSCCTRVMWRVIHNVRCVLKEGTIFLLTFLPAAQMKFEKATVFFKTRKHNLFDTKNIPQLQKLYNCCA